jgi:type IV pilus assembly protein PilM
MIKNIFLPERIGNHFIFSQTYLGLEFTKTMILGTKVNISGSSITLYDFYHEPIIKKDGEDNNESIIQSLQTLIKKTKTTHIKLSLANNNVIFKELTLPFLDYEKISQILPFKLEAEIPFHITDISFDFIVTKTDVEKNETTILIGIIQKKNLEYYIDILKDVKTSLASVTVDLFSIYGLYQVHPEYSTLREPVALIDIGFQSSTIAYIKDQQLLTNRTINFGLNTIAKHIALKTNKTAGEILEYIVKQGTSKASDTNYNTVLDEALHIIFSQIQFTFNAFASQIPNYEAIKKIILLTRGTKIKDIENDIAQALQIPTEYFNTHLLLTLHSLKKKHHITDIPLVNLPSFGAVYPFTPTSNFDLLKTQEIEREKTIAEHQIIATFVMVLLFFSTVIGYNQIQKGFLKKQINHAKRSALTQLKNELDIIDNNLSTAVVNAKTKLDETEAIWEGFSESSRSSYLKYLQELSVKIDRIATGLDLKQLIINKQSILMFGKVRDYKALKILEEELSSSKLFKLATIPQEESFEIKLVITQDTEVPS